MLPRTVAVGLLRPDEKPLAETRCPVAPLEVGETDASCFNDLHLFRLGVGELSGLALAGQSLPGKMKES
jgi:hypothetical protein